jgi:hypothetical protein
VRAQEMKVAVQRLERLKNETAQAEELEMQMQNKYADLLRFARSCGVEV